MVRFFYFTFILLTNTLLSASNMNDIKQLRQEFNLAIEDSKKASNLYEELLQLKPASNTLQYAYLGATEALLAKHSFNPFSKLSYVNNALAKLNKAVALSDNNIEIRYMRFSVEANMPAYLGYSKHVVDDKNMLIQGLKSALISKDNSEMYTVFANGIMTSNHCSKDEKILLANIIAACNAAKLIKK